VIPLSEAQEYVLSGCEPLGTDSVASVDALGLVTAEPIVSNEQIPPFDNTAVDGFAVIAADTATVPTELAIAGGIAAGEAPSVPVTPGSAIRIMTGAPMPDGAPTMPPSRSRQRSAPAPRSARRAKICSLARPCFPRARCSNPATSVFLPLLGLNQLRRIVAHLSA